tara:strand:+ start:63 stop:209 length:147 start_codon:yes stop_codon:yes gene_type:complete
MQKDKDFLQWIHNRLRYIHHEPAPVEYMQRLQAIIDSMNEEASNERTD